MENLPGILLNSLTSECNHVNFKQAFCLQAYISNTSIILIFNNSSFQVRISKNYHCSSPRPQIMLTKKIFRHLILVFPFFSWNNLYYTYVFLFSPFHKSENIKPESISSSNFNFYQDLPLWCMENIRNWL